jgi:hypothetical protein
MEDFNAIANVAQSNRKTSVTNLNEHSSRSHMILAFEVARRNRSCKSTISLVDLAGSESASRANTKGQQLQEGGHINQSLLSLGNVVAAIVEGRPHVPYRESKLTRLLRHSLGGNGLTFILCCVNPSKDNFEQTTTSLLFAQRAMKIQNNPVQEVTMPPLFMHQVAAATAPMAVRFDEVCRLEVQRGIADAYSYCHCTVASIVEHYDAKVSSSVRALSNMQRLLLAHDHSCGEAHLSQLHSHLDQLRSRKEEHVDFQVQERKRLREATEEIALRKEKLRKLETEIQNSRSREDIGLAELEYQLQEAKKNYVSPIDVLVARECYERWRIHKQMASSMITTLSQYNITFSVITEQLLTSATDIPSGMSKTQGIEWLRQRHERLRRDVDELEIAFSMIKDELPSVNGDAGRDEGVPDSDIQRRIQQLEEEEVKLRAVAVSEARLESASRVRNQSVGQSVSRCHTTATPPRMTACRAAYVSPYSQKALRTPPRSPATPARSTSTPQVPPPGPRENEKTSMPREVRHAMNVLRDVRSRLLATSPAPEKSSRGRSKGVATPVPRDRNGNDVDENTPIDEVVGIAARKRLESERMHCDPSIFQLSLSPQLAKSAPARRAKRMFPNE